MYTSKTYGANDNPACGRAVTGKVEIETSMVGKSSIDGSRTGNPVSGLIAGGRTIWVGGILVTTSGAGAESVELASIVSHDLVPMLVIGEQLASNNRVINQFMR
jgi:hypothetical protein